jgi:hypothetical protein
LGTVRPQEPIEFARAAFQAGKTVLSWFVDEEVAEVDQSQIIERPRLQLIEAQGGGKGLFLRAGLKVLCVNQGVLRSGLQEIVPQPGLH